MRYHTSGTSSRVNFERCHVDEPQQFQELDLTNETHDAADLSNGVCEIRDFNKNSTT